MAEGEDENKKNENKGFAGLSALVSNLDMSPPPAAKKESAGTSSTSSRSSSSSTEPAPSQPQPQPRPQSRRQQTYKKPTQSLSDWLVSLVGIAVIVGFFWLIGLEDKTTSPSASSNSSSTQSSPSTYSPPVQRATSSTRSEEAQVSSRPKESRPEIGHGVVLSRAEIRYCLAEKIRLNAADSAVNNYVSDDVDRFNMMVSDYNSRCSSFKYMTNNRGRNDLKSAQRDIEPYESEIESEGRKRFSRDSSLSSESRHIVQSIQNQLNDLGYEVGQADGLVGPRTRASIIAFQRNKGLAMTGVADQSLLVELERASSLDLTSSSPSAPGISEAQSILLDALRLQPGVEERVSDSGSAIVALAKSGYVDLTPDTRIDYTDYRLFKKSMYIFGGKLLVIGEQYFKEWIGCCVNPGISVTLTLDGGFYQIKKFADENKCRIGLDGDLYYGPKIPVPPGETYATMICNVVHGQ